MGKLSVDWTGVFPAVTTQFDTNLKIDFDATQATVARQIEDGVHGIIALGTCGENNSLRPEEKRDVLKAIVETAAGRVPVVTGVSELTTMAAADYARDAETIGVDGLMALPAMVYTPNDDELVAHFADVAAATSLPIMIYNNPAAYRVSISIENFERLAKIDNIAAIKESSEDIRRITDLYNAFGDRYWIMAGLDDVALEALAMGAKGWISGLTNAFPAESVAIWNLFQAGKLEARARGLSLVHSAAASRRAPRPRPMHQAVRTGDGTRLGTRPPASPRADRRNAPGGARYRETSAGDPAGSRRPRR